MSTFQSHFGLILSRWNGVGSNLPHVYFQSHFGLILSASPLSSAMPGFQSFNPILVWFYHKVRINARSRGDILSIPFWSDFIVHQLLENSQYRLPFNPILVWFYLWREIPCCWHYRHFQSHFGLILSCQFLTPEPLFVANGFQSHFGLILSDRIYCFHVLCYWTFNPILVWFYQLVIFLCFAI